MNFQITQQEIAQSYAAVANLLNQLFRNPDFAAGNPEVVQKIVQIMVDFQKAKLAPKNNTNNKKD